MSKLELFDIKFDSFDFEDLAGYLHKTIAIGEPKYMVTCNVDHLMILKKDSHFRRVYEEADSAIADGMPIVWASRILGKPLKRRLSGSDILPELGYVFERKRYRIFFLGAAEGVAEAAKAKLLERFPALNIVGCYSPPYGFEQDEEENDRIVEMLREASPDIVFVGVGAPKQEKWIHRNYERYRAPISIGIGGTFDLLAGNVKRAPRWMQRTGFEWVWRLFQEPKRLWKRYLVDDIKFIQLMIHEVKNKRGSARHGTYTHRR